MSASIRALIVQCGNLVVALHNYALIIRPLDIETCPCRPSAWTKEGY